jgi:hypothetical protein
MSWRRTRDCLRALAGRDPGPVGSLLAARVPVGLCRALQNLTLLVSFTAVSRRHHTSLARHGMLASTRYRAGLRGGRAIAQLTSVAAFLVAGVVPDHRLKPTSSPDARLGWRLLPPRTVQLVARNSGSGPRCGGCLMAAMATLCAELGDRATRGVLICAVTAWCTLSPEMASWLRTATSLTSRSSAISAADSPAG